jgi:hypothetical protein
MIHFLISRPNISPSRNTVHLMGFRGISGKRLLDDPLTRLRAEAQVGWSLRMPLRRAEARPALT